MEWKRIFSISTQNCHKGIHLSTINIIPVLQEEYGKGLYIKKRKPKGEGEINSTTLKIM